MKNCYICPFKNEEKSKPYLDDRGRLINQAGKTYCEGIDGWVEKTTPCEAIKKLKGEEKAIFCSACRKELVTLHESRGEVFNIEATDNLLSSRKRRDGTIGFQCSCGNSNLRDDSKVSDWNTRDASFIIEERKK